MKVSGRVCRALQTMPRVQLEVGTRHVTKQRVRNHASEFATGRFRVSSALRDIRLLLSYNYPDFRRHNAISSESITALNCTSWRQFC